MISAVVVIFFFSKTIAIIGLTVLFISDVMAAIIGRKFGKKKLFFAPKKT